MLTAALPTSFQHGSARLLRGPVPSHFEAFYRQALRFSSGPRIKAATIGRLYGEWATQAGAPSMNAREVRRAMLNIGHRHIHSNGMHFADVQRASDDPSMADNFPAAPISGDADGAILGRIERMTMELEQLRRDFQAKVGGRVAGPSPGRPPLR